MPSYMSLDATKHNGTARKTTLADFGIERQERPPRTLTETQIEAYARRKSEARKRYEEQQKEKYEDIKTKKGDTK